MCVRVVYWRLRPERRCVLPVSYRSSKLVSVLGWRARVRAAGTIASADLRLSADEAAAYTQSGRLLVMTSTRDYLYSSIAILVPTRLVVHEFQQPRRVLRLLAYEFQQGRRVSQLVVLQRVSNTRVLQKLAHLLE